MSIRNSMKRKLCRRNSHRRPLLVIGLLLTIPPALLAQKTVVTEEPALGAQQTQMDLPADFHRYYGQNVNQWKDSERKIAKADLDADMNYDGVIQNDNPADGGAFEVTPPGLILGRGEMARFLFRIFPYRLDYPGEVVVTLEVGGINRAAKSGQFASFAEEQAATGRIRVWADNERKQLLLDSGDPDRRYHEWVVDAPGFVSHLPNVYPRLVYVEGVEASPKFLGDLRLLLTVSHRHNGGSRENYGEYRQKAVKSFRTTFDHFLLTVTAAPHPKDFVNNNVEGVWISPASLVPDGK